MYKQGQIFENEYPMEAAIWCNENNLIISELSGNKYIIEKVDGIPGETLEEARQRATRAINSNTHYSIMQGTDYKGYHYSFDTNDQLNFNQTAWQNSNTVQWSATKSNTKHQVTLTRAEFNELYNELISKREHLLNEGTARKQEIASCTSVAEVNALLEKYYG